MDNNLIRCSQISVDCVANDPVDIRCGGPEYLGFDFNVRVEQTEEMKKFIAVTLEIFEIPLIFEASALNCANLDLISSSFGMLTPSTSSNIIADFVLNHELEKSTTKL